MNCFKIFQTNLGVILQCITTFRRFGTNANAGDTNTKIDQCSLSIAICGAKLKPTNGTKGERALQSTELRQRQTKNQTIESSRQIGAI